MSIIETTIDTTSPSDVFISLLKELEESEHLQELNIDISYEDYIDALRGNLPDHAMWFKYAKAIEDLNDSGYLDQIPYEIKKHYHQAVRAMKEAGQPYQSKHIDQD